MLSLEVVRPGDGLSMVPSQAATATAAYSCDRTVAAPLSSAGGRLAVAVAGGTGSDGDGIKIHHTLYSAFYHISPVIFRLIRLVSFNIRIFAFAVIGQ